MTRSPVLTLDEAAARAKMSRETVQRAVARGELAVIRVGRCTRFLESTVDGWLRSKQTFSPRGLGGSAGETRRSRSDQSARDGHAARPGAGSSARSAVASVHSLARAATSRRGAG